MDKNAARRVGLLSQHLACEPTTSSSETQRAFASGASLSSSSPAPAISSYASATGRPTTYSMVHGLVSRAPATWRAIESVHKHRLEEVKYEKAVGEGIAKVRALQAFKRQENCRLFLTPVKGRALSASLVLDFPTMKLFFFSQITINRPHKRNAFTPLTSKSLSVTEAHSLNSAEQFLDMGG